MDAADQSAREKKGYGDGLTQALTLVGGPRALRALRGVPRRQARDAPRCSSSCSGSSACSRRASPPTTSTSDRIARHDEGKPWAATHAVNPEIASADPSVAYEGQIAGDLARRVLIVSPAVLLVAGLVSGVDGAISAAIGLVLVGLNFLASAALITCTARRSPGAVMGVVLGGYIVRLGDPVRHRARARAPSRGSTSPCSCSPIAVVHLALLTWETRHVSLTLAAPA